MKVDLYVILGVSRDAPKSSIKKAWKKMAQKHHPDREDGDEELFKQIVKAYEVLSDDEARAHYDATGEEEPKREQMNQAEIELIALFDKIIEDDGFFNRNIIKYLRETIIRFKADGNSEKGKAMSSALKYRRFLNRITDPDGEPTFLEEVILRKVKAQEARISFIEKKQKLLDEMLDLVNTMSDNVVEPPKPDIFDQGWTIK